MCFPYPNYSKIAGQLQADLFFFIDTPHMTMFLRMITPTSISWVFPVPIRDAMGKFDTNELFLELAVISYNILRMIGQEINGTYDVPMLL
jgi:hypothetical protein